MTGPITLTVLGGYLGAGKTTLLNEILASPTEERIAVIVNDFGEVNIDAQLVRSRSSDTLELSNGCVCCSLVDGMSATMERVRAMRPAPQRALVEVSGVGNPGAVAAWGDLPGFRRGGSLVCVDPGTIEQHAADKWVGDTIRSQLESADAILLTKSDVRPADDVRRVRGWLQNRSGGAPLIDRAEVAAMLHKGFASAAPDRAAPVADRSAESTHLQRHTAWSVTFASPVAADHLSRALDELPAVVERVKGIVPVVGDGGPRRALINRAGGAFGLQDEGSWDGTAGRLILIAPVPPGEIQDPTGLLSALARRAETD